jgi:membrane associated rhomboid family serine protease
VAQTCYRHPDRETGVSCSSCGRPICPDCMTPTPVGMRCPECARQRTKVTRGVGEASLFASAPATFILIALNVVAFLAEIASSNGGFTGVGSSTAVGDFGLYGIGVAEGEWYRLLTGGFLHASFVHIAFNMFALFFLGRMLEPSIGTARFVFVYIASLFGGAFGALLLSGPDTFTIGASGAIFGLFGAAFVIARGRGFDAVAGSIGVVLLLNLAISFGTPRISLGGHLGGLVVGVICALVIIAGDRGRLGPNRLPAELIAMTAMTVVSIVASIAIA